MNIYSCVYCNNQQLRKTQSFSNTKHVVFAHEPDLTLKQNIISTINWILNMNISNILMVLQKCTLPTVIMSILPAPEKLTAVRLFRNVARCKWLCNSKFRHYMALKSCFYQSGSIIHVTSKKHKSGRIFLETLSFRMCSDWRVTW